MGDIGLPAGEVAGQECAGAVGDTRFPEAGRDRERAIGGGLGEVVFGTAGAVLVPAPDAGDSRAVSVSGVLWAAEGPAAVMVRLAVAAGCSTGAEMVRVDCWPA